MDRACRSCERDPGKGSSCRHCGARVYRFAVDHDEWEATVGDDGYAVRDATGPSDRELVGDAFADLDVTPSETIDELVGAGEPEELLYEADPSLRQWPPPSAPEPVSAGPVSQPRRGCSCAGCLGLIIILAIVAAVGALFMGGVRSIDVGSLIDEFLEEAGFDQTVVEVDGAGPCLDLEVDGSIVVATTEVPCAGPHDAEQYHLELFTDATFPGPDVLASRASSVCFDEFEGYVGRAYATSMYYYDWLVPTESGWDAGDRELICTLVSGDGAPLVGAGKGSGR